MQTRRDTERDDRWIAIEPGNGEYGEDARGDEIASVTAFTRPDARTFLGFIGDDRAVSPLVQTIAAERPHDRLHAMVDEAEVEHHAALAAAGFELEVVEDVYTVPFERAIRRFSKAPTPTGYSIISAADADRDRLVELDNLVRQDVPGCDGWAGDRAWQDAELADAPPFAPDAYLIGIDGDGDYAGLIRIWRNRSGPRFGLVGVARPHRHTTLGAALLRQALTAASRWGSPTFTAETSPSNPVIHRRMDRLGGVRTARLFQMVRMPR